MPATITRSDFAGIADIANHCDLNKLSIAINEAKEFDLADLFCDFWYSILEKWEDPTYENLVTGGTYEGCNGTRSHAGIKRIWAYYAYSRYIIINGFNDTPNGQVSKTNDFSIPKPLRELESLADKYRNMGHKEFKKTMAYLCKNATDFQGFNNYECEPCGCNGICGTKTSSTKGYGISGTNISKYD